MTGREIERCTIVKVMEKGGIRLPDGVYLNRVKLSCVFPDAHKNGDRHPSAWLDGPGNVYGCSVCGTFTAKGMAEKLRVAWPIGSAPPISTPAPPVALVRAAVNIGIHGAAGSECEDTAVKFLESRGIEAATHGPDPLALIWPVGGEGLPDCYADLAARDYRLAVRLYDARTGALASLQARFTGTGDAPDGKKTMFAPGADQARGKAFANLPSVAMMRGSLPNHPKRAIVGEGLTDFLALSLACPDVPVVATAGAYGVQSAYGTPVPRWIRPGMEIISALDGDEPGEVGAQALAVACRSAGAIVRRVKYPEGCKDACDIMRASGLEALRAALDAAEYPAAIRHFGKSSRPIQEYRMTKLETPPSIIGDGLLRIRQFGLLFGAPGGGKTFAALDLAVSVATGRDWYGIPVRQSRAGYLSLELERWDLTARIESIMAARGLTEDDLGDRLHLISPPDWDESFDLINPDHMIALQVWIQSNEIDLAIIDTLTRAHTADERDLRPVSNAALDIVRRTNSAILFVHHPRKPSPQSGPPGQRTAVMFEARGDSRLLGDARFVVSLTARRKVMQMTVEKTNTGAPVPPVYLKPDGNGVLHVTELPKTRQEQAAENRERIMEVMDQSGEPMSRSEIVAETGIPEDQVKRALASLSGKDGPLESSGSTRDRRFSIRAVDSSPEKDRPNQEGIEFKDDAF